MAITYEQWCAEHTDIRSLVRSMRSSLPEQYIGFYLQKAFGEEAVVYQQEFDWLGNSSLDIFIPSLQLAIEYDGNYYHSQKRSWDIHKTDLARAYGIYVIRVLEKTKEQPKSRKHNEISYYYAKEYKNIGVAINELFRKINKKYGLSIESDVNIERDEADIISYVQNKYHKRTVAYIWPESVDYWDHEANADTIYDVLCTSNGEYKLKCPHCGKQVNFFMRYNHDIKSLAFCKCDKL